MSCQKLLEFLTEYVDGQLPMSQRLAFELHLAICRDCRSYLHNFKATIAATKQASNDVTDMPEDLVKAILNSRRGQQP